MPPRARPGLLCSTLLFALAASGSAQIPARGPSPSPAPKSFVVLFRTGPGWVKDKPPGEQAHFAEHSRNLRALHAEGTLLLGGRYADVGLVVLRAADEAAVRALVDRDPAVGARVFSYEIFPWSTFAPGCVGTPARPPQ